MAFYSGKGPPFWGSVGICCEGCQASLKEGSRRSAAELRRDGNSISPGGGLLELQAPGTTVLPQSRLSGSSDPRPFPHWKEHDCLSRSGCNQEVDSD